MCLSLAIHGEKKGKKKKNTSNVLNSRCEIRVNRPSRRYGEGGGRGCYISEKQKTTGGGQNEPGMKKRIEEERKSGN